MSERQEIIERLRAVELIDNCDSHAMLSEVCRAVYPYSKTWNIFACEGLRRDLIRLLEDADEEIDAVRHECSERLEWMADESMPLPRDADGVPIHVGDVMEFSDGERFDVVGIGGHTLYYYDEEDEAVHWTRASSKRHHKEES